MNQFETISTQILYHTACELAARGIDVSGDPQWDPVTRVSSGGERPRITYSQGNSLIQKALTLTNDETLGLAVGHRQSISSLGLMASGLLASPTRMDALNLGLKYQELAGNMVKLELLSEGDNGDVVLQATPGDTASDVARFLVDEIFITVAKIFNFLTPDEKPFDSITLTFDVEEVSTYKKYFDCSVVAKSDRNTVRLRQGVMDQKLETADPFSLAEITTVLDELMIARKHAVGFLDQVQHILLRNLRHPAKIGDLANELQLSERTFRRRLNANGTGYRDLIDDLRYNKAMELLTNSELSITEISAELGFTDPRGFRRLITSLTGKSPREIRRDSTKNKAAT